MDETLGIALFGLGRAGQFHLTNLSRHTRARLLYVVDIDEKRTQAISALYGCKGTTNAQEALADPAVKAVIIATPTPDHHPLIIAAIRAKKSAIFTEKPVGFSLKEIDEAFNEAKASNIPILCGFNRRFDRSWIKAAESVHSGKIGKTHLMRCTARDSPIPSVAYLKTSHGFYHDSGSHDIDVMRWVLNESPIEVYTIAHCYLPQIAELGDVDTILMSFRFASGKIATIDLSRSSTYGYDQRIEVYGDSGMVQVENKPTTSCVISNDTGVINDNVMYSFPQRFEEAYYLELDHFVQVALDGATPRVNHEDCRSAYIIADCAKRSADTKQPVKIDYNIN